MCKPRLYLEEGDAHQDPGHHNQVVLQPLLKLAHTAFGVDRALLLKLLRTQRTRLSRSAAVGLSSDLPSSTLPSPPHHSALPNSVCVLEFCHRAFAQMPPSLGLSLAVCSEGVSLTPNPTHLPSKSSAELSHDCP